MKANTVTRYQVIRETSTLNTSPNAQDIENINRALQLDFSDDNDDLNVLSTNITVTREYVFDKRLQFTR